MRQKELSTKLHANPFLIRGNRGFPFLVLLICGLLVWPFCSYSNELQPQQHGFTEADMFADIPIVLSAARMPQPSIDAPASISVITREMIDASGALEIADVLRLVPGFQVSYVNGNALAVTYHGATYGYPRKLQVLIDGRSVYRPLLSNVDWVNLGIALIDIQRIEVIRGPNTPAYGSNAFSGTINIITREPFQDNGYAIQATAGSQVMRESILKYASNAPGFSFRSTIGYRHDQGFDDVDDERHIASGSFRGVYDISTRQSLDTQLGFSGGEMGAGGIDSLLNPFRNKDVSSYFGHIRYTNTIATDEEYYIQLYHNFYEQKDQFQVGPLSTVLGISPIQVPIVFDGQPDQSITAGIYDGLTDRTDLEFQYMHRPVNELRFVWGAGLRRDRLQGQYVLDQSDYVVDSSQRLFANFEWRATPSTVINAGVMTEDNDIVGNMTSPRVAFNYSLTNKQAIRVSATKAYRSPSLYEANNIWTIRFQDGELLYTLYDHDDQLEPEELTSYELGYIIDLNSPNLLLDFKLYKENLSHLIGAPDDLAYQQPEFLIDVSDDAAKVWSNNGYLNTQGFEIQLNYRPGKDTLFNLGYAYAEADGELAETINPVSYEAMKDNVPQHTLSALLDKSWSGNWRTSLAYYYVDEMEWGGDGDYIDKYDRWDMRVAKIFKFNGQRISFNFIAHNLLNESYQEFRSENNFDRRFYVQLQLMGL